MKITGNAAVEKTSAETSFIILGAGRPHYGKIPSAIQNTSGDKRVLDWLLATASSLNPNLFFVGGYQFEDIQRQYSQMSYVFNPEWECTGPAFSFLNVPFTNINECFVSYADIVFGNEIIKKINEVEADIVVVVDSLWRQRYRARSDEDLLRCEKVIFEENNVTHLGQAFDPNLANGEFIGLVRFLPNAVKFIRENIHMLQIEFRETNLSQIVEFLRLEGYRVKAVDIKGDWAELNAPADLVRFVMGTKAQTLLRLKGMVKQSKIEDQVAFTIAEWDQQKANILISIAEIFKDQKCIVRSSSLNEDSFTQSNAGVYKSILNVACNNVLELNEAIENVITSYSDNNKQNQVLIQPMVSDISASGVILTKTLIHSAPYYVINYDDTTQNTESITSGNGHSHKTMFILRETDINSDLVPVLLRGLLPAVQEIEHLLHYDSLDMEFAIDSQKKVYIFQVRPIVFKKDHPEEGSTDQELYEVLGESRALFCDLQTPAPSVIGEKAFFGIMPDWNPAEIIGTKPGTLATSLYRYLIMDDIWATQRAEYGYRDVRPSPLLVTFGGHPYVDIRASFNSFIPADLSNELSGRLVNFYLSWLEKKPYLHDKIEFEVVPTCYAFDFVKWERRLLKEDSFSPEEISNLKRSLKKITESAFTRNKQDLDLVATLEKRYNDIVSKNIPPLERAIMLLDDCRCYGTLAFSHLARSAFVGLTLLRSAVEDKIITEEAMNSFLNSIRTIAHKFTDDASSVANGTLSWEAFLSDYGHLRPGTYDITSQSYAENPDFFLQPLVKSSIHKKTNTEQLVQWKEARNNFSIALKRIGLHSDIDQIESFMREAIEGREYAKFIFTRNLSAALTCLIEFGDTLGLTRKDLSNISLDIFLAIRKRAISNGNLTDLLLKEAKKGQQALNVANRIELSPLLFTENDFRIFLYPENRPNFIGIGQVIAPCFVIENIENIENKDLTDHIVLIPQADPGYDWLFAQGIAGLVTMWGGVNSHMAIRCAEFGLPAAIGVGDVEFNRLRKALVLELNAGNHIIQILR